MMHNIKKEHFLFNVSISYTLSLKNCADRFFSSITEVFLYHIEKEKTRITC